MKKFWVGACMAVLLFSFIPAALVTVREGLVLIGIPVYILLRGNPRILPRIEKTSVIRACILPGAKNGTAAAKGTCTVRFGIVFAGGLKAAVDARAGSLLYRRLMRHLDAA